MDFYFSARVLAITLSISAGYEREPIKRIIKGNNPLHHPIYSAPQRGDISKADLNLKASEIHRPGPAAAIRKCEDCHAPQVPFAGVTTSETAFSAGVPSITRGPRPNPALEIEKSAIIRTMAPASPMTGSSIGPPVLLLP
jgi:hypothetical protein